MGDVKALFGLIDKKNKPRLIGAVICCVLSVLCGILPYLGVWGIVTCFHENVLTANFRFLKSWQTYIVSSLVLLAFSC